MGSGFGELSVLVASSLSAPRHARGEAGVQGGGKLVSQIELRNGLRSCEGGNPLRNSIAFSF